MRGLRVILSIAVLGSALAASSASAAGKPVGGCPVQKGVGATSAAIVPFFLLAADDPRLGDISGLPSVDGNGDGLTCVQLITLSPQGNAIRFAAVDNVVPLR